MKVRLDTPERLVLDERPLFLGPFLALLVMLFALIGVVIVLDMPRTGVAFLGIAGFWGLMMALFVRRTVVVFDRPSRRVTWQETTITGRREERLFLNEITGAVVQSGGGMAHRCVLTRVEAPPFPLTEVATNGGGPARAALAINDWLGRQRPTPLPATGRRDGPEAIG